MCQRISLTTPMRLPGPYHRFNIHRATSTSRSNTATVGGERNGKEGGGHEAEEGAGDYGGRGRARRKEEKK